MINSTPEYEYKQANTKDIFVDPLYQRDLDNSKVSKIVRDWNPLSGKCGEGFLERWKALGFRRSAHDSCLQSKAGRAGLHG